MRLSHNMFSAGIYKKYKSNLVENSKALNNISTGKKLNTAKDNPSKITQSENLKMNLLCRDAASQNIQDTNSMLQTFDGAAQEINNNLTRLKQLTVSAANGTQNDGDKATIQIEIDKIKEDITYLAENTSFNGISMSTSVNPITSTKSIIGALSDESIDIPFFDLSNTGLGINGIDVTDNAKLGSNIESVDKAVIQVSSIRSKYGSIQSRLSDSYDNMAEMNQPLSAAQSSLEDADIAEESLQYSRTQILYKAAIGLMTQSNKLPQDALNVLSRI